MIVKNTYGISVAFTTSRYGIAPKSEFTGSALQRKKPEKLESTKAKKKESTDNERKALLVQAFETKN